MNGGTATTTERAAMAAPPTPVDVQSSVESKFKAEFDTLPSPRSGSEPRHAQYERSLTPHSQGGDLQTTTGHREATTPCADFDDAGAQTKMRPKRMTIELPNDPIDVLYDRKLSIEDPSPKPCIVPGNALHLIDDDPSPRSQTPSSVIIVSNDRETSPAQDQHSSDVERSSSEPPPTAARPAPRVRFRSRVRITSGVHRHRHSTSGAGLPNSHTHLPSGSITPSSGTSSPSSSISAPLRYHADENGAWGTLGRRINAHLKVPTRQKRLVASAGSREGGGNGPGMRQNGHGWADERTPLVRAVHRQGYVNPHREGSQLSEGDEEECEEELSAAALRREEEEIYGPWPGRLLNRHWWWWHLEPVLCCTYCSEDSDYEE